MTPAKAIKKLTKKLGREPTEDEVSAFVEKKNKKRAAAEPADEEEAPAKKAKKDKKEKKSKKEKKEEPEDEGDADAPAAAAPAAAADTSLNPDRVSKIFMGNLSYDVNDSSDPATNTDISGIFGDCGTITDIFFLTDKETGRFYGTGFVTFSSPEEADAALAKNGQEVCGRPIKIDAAKPKPGGDKPRTPKVRREPTAMSEMEDGCVTMFMGNLSFDIDPATNDNPDLNAFFKDCGEIKNVRWLTDRETGDFKGCGFIEFCDSSAVQKAAALNGQDLKGRQIRLDYAKARAPKAY